MAESPWPKRAMVLDVEAQDLHKEGFAVAWVVVDLEAGETLAEGYAGAMAFGPVSDWVAQNVLPVLPAPTHLTPRLVRSAFWQAWEPQHECGAWLAAEVPWPVEARFLAACVDDRPERAASAPYPLLDVASMRLAAGAHPLSEVARLPEEMPPHNPLADARQSARLLLEVLRRGSADAESKRG